MTEWCMTGAVYGLTRPTALPFLNIH